MASGTTPILTAAEQELEWRKCRGEHAADVDACLYFLATYWHIRHPARGRIRFDLRPAQIETLRVWIEERNSIVLKARQIGFSTLVAALAFWETFFWEDHAEVMLSRTEREAKKLLKKTKYGYKFLPAWLKERGPQLTSETQTVMEWDNESEIESLPSKQDPARGEAVYRVFVDEWAFLDNPDDAWASIEPIADVGGRITGLSTANGSGEFFHTFWIKARTGVSDFVCIFFPWSANTDRNDDWYATKKRNMPDWQLAQEYPQNEDEAFIKSGNPVFDTEMIDALEPVEPAARGVLVPLGLDIKNFEFEPASEGELRVWEFPQSNHTYVVGADIAQGDGGDFSVAQVIDVRSGAQVAVWHGYVDPDDFGAVLCRIGHWYNRALVAPEANSFGMTTVRSMQRLRYPRIYRRRTMGNQQDKLVSQMGWLTTSKSKPTMIAELNGMLKIGDLLIYDKFTVAELRTYQRHVKGQTVELRGQPYDDRVTALAIAGQMIKHVFDQQYEDPEDDYMTGAWWSRQLHGEREDLSDVIGAHSVRRTA